MTPSACYLNFLSFLLDKIQKYGQFWNPQNEQISKLTLLFKFGEDFIEILTKNQLWRFFSLGILAIFGQYELPCPFI